MATRVPRCSRSACGSISMPVKRRASSTCSPKWRACCARRLSARPGKSGLGRGSGGRVDLEGSGIGPYARCLPVGAHLSLSAAPAATQVAPRTRWLGQAGASRSCPGDGAGSPEGRGSGRLRDGTLLQWMRRERRCPGEGRRPRRRGGRRTAVGRGGTHPGRIYDATLRLCDRMAAAADRRLLPMGTCQPGEGDLPGQPDGDGRLARGRHRRVASSRDIAGRQLRWSADTVTTRPAWAAEIQPRWPR